MSYIWAEVRPPKDQTTLEGWIIARFGWRLYSHFFKTYNEKLWGVPVNKLPADFAAQRIKNLSLFNAVVNTLLPKRNQKDITSLIEEFQYPKFGPGMMWERCRELVEAQGCKVMMDTRVIGVRHEEAGRSRSSPRRRRRPHRVPVRPRDLVDADLAAAAGDGPACRRHRWWPPPTTCGTATSSPSRSSCRRSTASRTTGSTCTPGGPGRADPELRLVVALPGEGGAHLPRPRVLRLRGRRDVDQGGRGPHRAGQARARDLGLVDPAKVEDGYVVRMPKAYPVLRRALQGQRRADRRVARGLRAERAPGRAQRHAPLQQPGPLDVHRHADGREHRHRLPPRRVDT